MTRQQWKYSLHRSQKVKKQKAKKQKAKKPRQKVNIKNNKIHTESSKSWDVIENFGKWHNY